VLDVTLTRRLSLLTATLIAVCTFTIALLAAVSGRNTATGQIDARLVNLRGTIRDTDDPLSALLQSASASSSDFGALLVVVGEDPIVLVEGSTMEEASIADVGTDQLNLERTTPFTVDRGLRLVTLDIGNEQWLVFGEDIRTIHRQFTIQLAANSMLALALSALGGAMAALVTRRSMVPLGHIVRYSRSVADGTLTGSLNVDAPTSEVRELQDSIGSMVLSLKVAADERTRSEAMMRDFLADVAHELRTPLTTVRAYSEILASDRSPDPETRVRAQDRIVQESKRMARLIDDLLLLARLASAPTERTSRLDVRSIVRAHLDDLAVLDPNRSINLQAGPCHIDANAALIERMVANIVSNIHRHSPADARVEVIMGEVDTDLEISFDDAGPGLDAQQLDRLAHDAPRFGVLRTGDQHGSGLGLHLVRSIARAHRGTVNFERSPLGGLRVRIRLPASNSQCASTS